MLSLSILDIGKFTKLFKFLNICLPAIEISMEDITSPPGALPSNIQAILEKVIDISLSQLSESWTMIKINIWEHCNNSEMTETFLSVSEIVLYNIHALPLETGKFQNF